MAATIQDGRGARNHTTLERSPGVWAVGCAAGLVLIETATKSPMDWTQRAALPMMLDASANPGGRLLRPAQRRRADGPLH